jgi:hypothetical protein
VTPAERITRALARIPDAKIRREIADAVEALADAHEFIAAGYGASELSGVQSGGFESSVPDGLRLLAAQVERDGRRELQTYTDKFRTALRHIYAESKAFRGVAVVYERTGPGRPTVVTPQMLVAAHRCRSLGMTPDAAIRDLCEQFGTSESALRSNLRRGRIPGNGGPSSARLLFLAVFGGSAQPPKDAATRHQMPQEPLSTHSLGVLPTGAIEGVEATV